MPPNAIGLRARPWRNGGALRTSVDRTSRGCGEWTRCDELRLGGCGARRDRNGGREQRVAEVETGERVARRGAFGRGCGGGACRREIVGDREAKRLTIERLGGCRVEGLGRGQRVDAVRVGGGVAESGALRALGGTGEVAFERGHAGLDDPTVTVSLVNPVSCPAVDRREKGGEHEGRGLHPSLKLR